MLVPDFKIEKKENFNLIGKVKVKILVVAACSVFALLSAQLVFANKLAIDGQKLAQIEEGIQQLEAQNTTLKVEIAKEASLASISQKAQKMGFATPDKVITP